MTGNMLPAEAFLSHSSLDRNRVTELVGVLRRHGIPTWYSEANILGAQQWQDEVGAAPERCDWFILVLTSHSVESMWTRRELAFALEQERFENRIVPLLYEDCNLRRLSWVLPSLQIVDFRTDLEAGYRTLLRIWGIGYRPALSAPP